MSSEVISRLISELKPHPRNYNNHSDRQVDDLALSLKRFGQRKPIVTWRDMIVAGHGLTMAAQMAGWTSILTMPIPDDWDEATVLAYLAADNELARQADPDLAQLAVITKELEGIDEELAKLAAGGDDALKALMATIEDEKPNGDAEPQIDKAEELRQKWDVQSGQMWQLGEHRIICGDCTDRAVVERVMGGEKADLMFTSPPYNNSSGGMKYDYSGDSKRFYKDESMDKKSLSEWLQLCDNTILRFSENCKNEESPAVWNVMYNANMRNGYGLSMFSGKHGMTVKETICWDKSTGFPTATKGILSRNWELVFVLSMGDSYFTTQGKNEVRYAKWDISNTNSQSTEHHAAFPIELPEMAIRWFSPDAAIVYEPFSGSGTTLIACENLSRKCRAVEISPAYVAVAIQRWVDVTGKEPILLDA